MLIWAHGLDTPYDLGRVRWEGKEHCGFCAIATSVWDTDGTRGSVELVHCLWSYIFHFMYHGQRADPIIWRGIFVEVCSLRYGHVQGFLKRVAYLIGGVEILAFVSDEGN